MLASRPPPSPSNSLATSGPWVVVGLCIEVRVRALRVGKQASAIAQQQLGHIGTLGSGGVMFMVMVRFMVMFRG